MVVTAFLGPALPSIAATQTPAPADAPPSEPDEAAQPTDSAPVPGTPVPAGEVLAGEVAIRVASFGVGNQARAGEWSGIRLELRDSASRQRNVIVRLSAVDADGDQPQYVRQITSNPGIWQGVWMYLRLPFAVDPAKDLRVEVFEAIEDESVTGATSPTPGVRPGRLLARQPVVPRNAASLLDPGLGMIAVLGGAKFGLDRYAILSPRGLHAPLGHEADVVVSGLQPGELPDRWLGLQQFSTLIWGEGEPAELRSERARAVREWVSRGGHLVIVLPSVGETWTNRNSNELFDILPVVTVTRNEGVDLDRYRPILTTDPTPAMPKNGVVYSLNPTSAAVAGEAIRVIDGPDGECLVARRLVGAGMVTLVGLDLTRPQFASGRALNPEIFWHRILGKRGRLPSSDQRADPTKLPPSRVTVSMDQDIPAEISKTGRSAAGVLLGLVVFAAYWLLAGPVGFLLLKRKALTRHAWVAFLGVGALFTVIAWGGATAIKPANVEASHLTLLDHVYGQPVQRARTFAAVLIPRYGTAVLQVGTPDEAPGDPLGRRTTNLIAPWEGSEERVSRSFPDSRGYGIDVRAPDTLPVPARATVKEIQADWVGGPRWRMPQPVNQDGTPGSIRVLSRTGAGAADSALEGTLVHELPAPIEDLRLILVQGQRPLAAPGRNVRPPEFTASGNIFLYNASWLPGEQLDLGLLTRQNPSARTSINLEQTLRSWIEKYDETGLGINSNAAIDSVRVAERLGTLAFFTQLGAPADIEDATRTFAVARRTMTHGWDLGRWFTQPCIIIVGTVGTAAKPAESPTPLPIDGEPIATKGRTLVRWVYPLGDRPPAWPQGSEPELKLEPLRGEPR